MDDKIILPKSPVEDDDNSSINTDYSDEYSIIKYTNKFIDNEKQYYDIIQSYCYGNKIDLFLEENKQVISAAINELITEDPFYLLEYTFLAQVGSRPDFGKRLCHLYAEWRDRMGNDMQPDFPAEKMPDLMVVIQAFLHGLAIQRLVDPMNINVKSAGQLFSAMIDQFLANSGNASENIRGQ